MLFNTIDFAIFLPIVFFLYWFVIYRNLKYQNLLIVVASFVFYGWWDWRFLFLILFSIVTDFFIGLSLKDQNDNRKRKAILWLSIIVNLGFLGFFKYYNFFEAEKYFRELANKKGIQIIGSYNPDDFGFTNDDFYDGMHPKEHVLEQLIKEEYH